MKKAAIGIGVLACIGLVAVAIRLAASNAVAEAERGLSPVTAYTLSQGRNTGALAPGERRWYEVVAGSDGAYQRQADLTMFFTPDDGNRAYRVHFQIFPADQVMHWYGSDAGQMQNLGAGSVVSRDGNPVTGELLWNGWVENSQGYFVEVFNDSEVPIDYWLFTGDVIGAELGPSQEPPPAAPAPVENEPPPAPPPPPVVVEAPPPVAGVPLAVAEGELLPVASQGQGGEAALASPGGDVPAGIPSRLLIPAIGLDSQVVPVGVSSVVVDGVSYAQWNTVNNLVGWHNLSARLGEGGNIVLNGHSDMNLAVFRDLERLRVGDEINLFSGDQVIRYVVAQRFLVKERDVSLAERLINAQWAAASADPRLTLITCANPGATHRLIVVARP